MIKSLTSLRFFFAFMVFLSHFTIDGVSLFEGGHIGVSFFFMLSGFILTYSYNDKMISGQVTKKSFWIARFARIYPLHIATLIVASIVSFIIVKMGGEWPVSNWSALPFNATLTQALIPLDSFYFSFNAVSWSISDEAFFYLVFPFMILFINNNRVKTLLIIAIIALIVYVLLTSIVPQSCYSSLFYINPLFRIFDYIIGIIICLLWKNVANSDVLKNSSIVTTLEVSSILLLSLFIYFSNNVPLVYTYGIYFWLPMAFVIFIFAQSNNNGVIAKLFSWKPLVILGEVSFGFYMIHQLVIGVSMRGLNIIGLSDLSTWIKFVVALSITIILSILSFYYFETPLNKWIKRKWAKN